MNSDIQQLSNEKLTHELIEWYVQHGRQLRSEAIAHGFHWVFTRVGHSFRRLHMWMSNTLSLESRV